MRQHDDALVWTFEVDGVACPQLPPRLINPFAKLGLTPRSISIATDEDRLHASISVAGLSSHQAEIISHGLAAIVTVEAVSLSPSSTPWLYVG